MPILSRRKGKDGELQLAALLRRHGFDEARRGVQYQGGPDSPDIVGLNGCHVEVKRAERGNPYDWLEKAAAEAPPGQTPVVFHRRSRKPWIVVLSAPEFLSILRQAEYGPPTPPRSARSSVKDLFPPAEAVR